MPFRHEIVVTESIEIGATPAELFGYLVGIVDDAGFKTLNADNIGFRWRKGRPWAVGSVAQAEKYLHGKPHRFTFVITRVVPDRHIEYRPTSVLMRRFFPRKEFVIEETSDGCRFISSATFIVGWIANRFFRKKLDEGLSSFGTYLREEGRNLKQILEARRTGPTAAVGESPFR